MNPKTALSLAIAVSMLLVHSAFAATEVVNGITWQYTVSQNKASIFNNDYDYGWLPAITASTSGAITIPATLGGYPVTSIGLYAFSGCSGLT
ncbi:MAG: hypothetical protein IKJ45_13595, partial [Kiritimatiellae bacterium]|nr:hypothetical protein [Kiritimatiellia bacterium]